MWGKLATVFKGLVSVMCLNGMSRPGAFIFKLAFACVVFAAAGAALGVRLARAEKHCTGGFNMDVASDPSNDAHPYLYTVACRNKVVWRGASDVRTHVPCPLPGVCVAPLALPMENTESEPAQ